MGPGSETTVDPDSSSGDTGTSTGGEPFDPFGPAIEIPLELAFDPIALAMADFDGDGDLDLLVTGTAGGVVAGATLLGDGDGGFGPPIDAGVTACSAFPIFGAIDDDEAVDLFFGTCSTEAIAHTATGDGTFAPVELLDGWFLPPVRSSRFADHDGDGDDDLLMLTVDDLGQVQVHLALHGDTLPWEVTTTDVAVRSRPAFEPNALVAASLSGDALVDVLLVEVDATLVSLRALSPVGHDDASVLPIDVVPSAVVAQNFYGGGAGGRDDLVVASRSEGALQVVHNDDDDGIEPRPPIDLGGLVPLEVVVGRFDDDVYDDFAVLDVAEPSVLAVRGTGGAYEVGATVELPSPAVRLLAGDLDDDQRPDLVAATFANGSVTVLLAE